MSLVAALFACGGATPKPAPEPPPIADTKPAEPPPAPPPVPVKVEPPAPKPIDVAISATTATVKLVTPGKGKRAKLVLAPKLGGKQQLELAMDFAAQNGPKSQVIPTMLLSGEAEVTAVDAGNVAYSFVVAGIDARDVAASTTIHAAQIKPVLETLKGLRIAGSVAPNGTAGAIVMHLDAGDQTAQSALELVRLALPGWPVLPAEPIGVGAKWTVLATGRVADKLEVSLATTYELTDHKGPAWTIKGTTTVSGADQAMEGGKITDISGAGTSEVTITDGALYSAYKSLLETKFTAHEPGKDVGEPFDLTIGGVVTIK